MDHPTLKHPPNDEPYWRTLSTQFAPHYTTTQLVNTRRGPCPLTVRSKIASLIDLSLCYEVESHAPFQDMKESGSSPSIRISLASYFGTSAAELALTRNAMDGLATVLNGLELQTGDEMLATSLCYDTNIAIMRQRCRREGLALNIFELPLHPITDGELVSLFEAAMSEKTKFLSFPHVFANTGLVLPVRALCAVARRRGAFTLVDGAHSAGHLDFQIDDLGCDAFAACLHKWMYGPRGTGFLYVRRSQIANVWPLLAPYSDVPEDSIEKFEEVGTVFKALPAAIPEMLAWNLEIGQAEKEARLRYLRDRWAGRLRTNERVGLLTDVEAVVGTSMGAFVVDEGRGSEEVAGILMDRFDINVRVFALGDSRGSGIHVSPGLANTVEEIDRFVEAVLEILAGDVGSEQGGKLSKAG